MLYKTSKRTKNYYFSCTVREVRDDARTTKQITQYLLSVATIPLQSYKLMKNMIRLKSMSLRLAIYPRRLENYDYAKSDNFRIDAYSTFPLIKHAHAKSRPPYPQLRVKQNPYHSSYRSRRSNQHDSRWSVRLWQPIAHGVFHGIRGRNPWCVPIFSAAPHHAHLVPTRHTPQSTRNPPWA